FCCWRCGASSRQAIDIRVLGQRNCYKKCFSWHSHAPCRARGGGCSGVKLGRPKTASATERKVRKQLAKGMGILKVAKPLGIGTGTVQRISKERAMSLRGAQQ